MFDTDDFFNYCGEQTLNDFESLYNDYLKLNLNSFNIGTGKKYTQKELDNLFAMCSRNLNKIRYKKRIKKIKRII